MKNYNTLSDILKEENVQFIKKLTIGLGKVDTHFITDMFTGFLKYNSVILSDIVRSTGNPNIKKGVERLERNLDGFDDISVSLEQNYINMVKPYINKRKLYFVDRGDIVKEDNTKFENKGIVLDGSDSHKIKMGYQINEISTIDNDNQPISLISELRSAKDTDYDSDNSLWLSHIKTVKDNYGDGTFIMDSWYDGGIIMKKILDLGQDFIIRGKHFDRNVYINGEKTTIRNIALNHKGFFRFDSTYKGQTYKLKVYSTTIRIKPKDSKDLYKHPLTLIIIKGYSVNEITNNEAYMALITSRNVSSKDNVLQVVRDYLLRWKIEENFKYKKQQFSFEKIMVRRYKRIQAINTLLTYSMFFSNVLNLKAIGKVVRKQKTQIKERVRFWLYRISEGIKIIIDYYSKEILKLLYPKRLKRRRDLFTVCGIRFNPNNV